MFVKAINRLPWVAWMLRSRRRGHPDLASGWLDMIGARDQSLKKDGRLFDWFDRFHSLHVRH
jgi:hypothetical protein